MKFIRNFEKYERKSNSRNKMQLFLNENDEKILEEFLLKYIDDKNVLVKVKKINFKDIAEQYYFVYENIFDDMLSDFKNNYESGTLYYDTDNFIRNIDIKYNTSLSIRNSMEKIIDKYWLKVKKEFSKILDNKLIKYFNKHHEDYKYYVLMYTDNISDYVKSECQWIIDHEKYNL